MDEINPSDLNCSQMCTIRIAHKEDATQLVDLMAAFYAESDYPFDAQKALSAFTTLIPDQTIGQCWLIEHNSTAVGYIAVTFTFSLEYFGHTAFIEDLYVLPEYRNRGLGRRALEVAASECRNRGVLALHLEVGEDNAVANSLYERFGFSSTDRRLLNKWLTEI